MFPRARMSRILLVQHSSTPDGSAHSGLLLADGLREAGWTVHVAFGHEGPMRDAYAAAGHQPHLVPHSNWLRRAHTHQFVKDVWHEWAGAEAFVHLIDEVAPRAVYVNTAVSLAGVLAAHRAHVPCVWHLREMFADIGGELKAPRWALPLLRRLLCRCADRLVTNSAATARNMLAGRAPEARVVPNAVGERFYAEARAPAAARAALGLPAAGPLIGVPGTLRSIKGHTFFLEAVAPLLHRTEGLQVAVTGQGVPAVARRVKAKARALGLRDRVLFLGWVDDMAAFYRACDLVCIPSRAEPFGRTAIEAFAVGTPVVATAVGGLQEIIAEGKTGRLVPYGDASALAAALHALLSSPEQRRTLSRRARREAEEHYHAKRYQKTLVALVQALVDTQSTPAPASA